jgi:parallel beta helix pectate lyase-like protein
MNRFRLTNPVLIGLISALAFVSVAQAQAPRTWVSGVGDDANPCSRTAPCKTFAGAISKTASGGEIDALDDAGFGAVTITKPITIEGGGHTAGILASGTNAVNVNVTTAGAVVALRNLDINGGGTGLIGINIIAAGAVFVDNCQIYGFQAGSGRAISDGRSAAQSTAPLLFVNDTFIRGNLLGIGVTGGSPTLLRTFVRNCRIQSNNGTAILGSNSAVLTVERSIITGNVGDGVRVDSGARASVVGCLISVNINGLVNSGGGGILLADTSIFDNSAGVSGTIVTFGNNNVMNNAGGNTLPATVGQQ